MLPANSQDPAHEALICPTAPLGADQRQRFANDKNPSLSLPPLPPLPHGPPALLARPSAPAPAQSSFPPRRPAGAPRGGAPGLRG